MSDKTRYELSGQTDNRRAETLAISRIRVRPEEIETKPAINMIAKARAQILAPKLETD